MAQACPISLHRVDANIVRIIAFEVVITTVLLLVTQELLFALILLFDFVVRTLRLMHLSPFYLVAKASIGYFSLTPKMCDESPKRFALYLGLAIALALVLLYATNFGIFATITASILLLCAVLEALFDYCIGCKIYYTFLLIKGAIGHGRSL
jgi:hypothetical protein